MDRRALAVVVASLAGLARPSHASVDDKAADQVWGQPDFTTATVPTVPSQASLSRPAGVATDSAHFAGPSAVAPLMWVADREAHRILLAFRSSEPEAHGLFGQTSYFEGSPNGGLASPHQLGVDAPAAVAFTTNGGGSPSAGFVAVADAENHRVLLGQYFGGAGAPAFNAAFVYGQHGDFNRGNRNDGGAITRETLAAPQGVAFGDGASSGWPTRLYVADTDNHRLLVFDPLAGGMVALACVGQPDCEHGAPNRGGPPGPSTLHEPRGLAWYAGADASDPARGLYVADTGNHRVLFFPAIEDVLSSTASRVWGQGGDFGAAIPSNGGPSATSLRSPTAVAIGPDGTLFVADTGHHRVLRFPKGALVADFVYGQPDFAAAAAPAAPSATTLRAPMGVAVAASGMLMVADTGHSRVLRWSARCDPAKCDDLDPCTDDTCDPFVGCRSQVVSTFSKACAPYRCDFAQKLCRTSCASPGDCQAPWKCVRNRCVVPCVVDGTCPEGLACADGVCCNERCDGACEACNEPGSEGTCVAVTGPPRNGHVCGEDADVDCRGTCTGFERKSCGPARDGAPCGVEACNGGVATVRGTCASGRCLSEERACAPYACGPASCRSSCEHDWQCAEGARCAGGSCLEGAIPAGGGCAFADRPRAAYGLVSTIAVALAAVGSVARRARRRS